MNDFEVFPDSVEELFTPDVFANVVQKSRKRLSARFLIDFNLAMHRIPSLCQLYLGSGEGPKYRTRERLYLVDDAAAVVRFRQAAARLCFWICDFRIVESIELQAGASEAVQSNYRIIDEYRTEFFGLLLSYDFYRHYVSRATGRIVPNWFAGREFRHVSELCAMLARTPHNSGAVFRLITEG